MESRDHQNLTIFKAGTVGKINTARERRNRIIHLSAATHLSNRQQTRLKTQEKLRLAIVTVGPSFNFGTSLHVNISMASVSHAVEDRDTLGVVGVKIEHCVIRASHQCTLFPRSGAGEVLDITEFLTSGKVASRGTGEGILAGVSLCAPPRPCQLFRRGKRRRR